MFASDSRYVSQPTYTVALPGGTQVTAVVPPLPSPAPLAGYAHGRQGAPRPRRGAVPQRADRLLAAVRREQLHARGRSRGPRTHRHPGRGPCVSVTVQLTVGGDARCPRGFYDAIMQTGDRGELGPARHAAAAAAGEPDLPRGPPVRRRRDLRADDERRAHGRPPARGVPDPVHLRRVRAVLAAAPGPRVDLVDDRHLGPGRVVADEHRRPRRPSGPA